MTDDDIRYARAHDGLHIAYQVSGEGPLVILEIGNFGTLFPMDAAIEQPRWHRFEERLCGFARLVKHDMRGIGYSDKFETPPTLDDYVRDAVAVLDAAGIERVVVMATTFGAFVAIELEARHPDRVVSLVLSNAGAYMAEDSETFDPSATEELLARRAAVDPASEHQGEQSDIDFLAPSIAHDVDIRRWWQRTARRGAGPVVAEAMWEFALTADVRDRLAAIAAPTLVICTTRNRFVHPTFGRWMAERIPGAELCEIPAADHVIWAAPDDVIVNEVERFLTGSVHAGGRRAMAAIVFTDIVESTSHNSDRGDRAWLELLERHDAFADREVRLRGGRVVKRLGDGLLAVFALASDALDAALAITSGAPDLGIEVRGGVHIAEIEHVGDDVLGLGVNVAARVLGLAGGGEVAVSRAVESVLAGASYSFEPHGTHELKGVPGTWTVALAGR